MKERQIRYRAFIHSGSPFYDLQAPFCKGEKGFRFESAVSDPNKNLLVSQALAIGEVRFKIMKYLSYHDIGSLQGTCTFVANRVMNTFVSDLLITMARWINMI